MSADDLLSSCFEANLDRWEPASSMSGIYDVPSQGASVGTEEKMNEKRGEIEAR